MLLKKRLRSICESHMGISELSQLPPLPELTGSEGAEKLQQAIDELQNAASPAQLTLSDVRETAKE